MATDRSRACLFFFFNDTATTEIYTLSLHDALPICGIWTGAPRRWWAPTPIFQPRTRDRKSTRLNSSHSQISYAVFCLKKKKRCSRFSATYHSLDSSWLPSCTSLRGGLGLRFAIHGV